MDARDALVQHRMMLASLRHNLGNLLLFSGRTGRQSFWLYAMVVLLSAGAAWAVAFGWVFSRMFARIHRFAIEHPELVRETRGAGSYSVEVDGYHPELVPDFSGLILVMGIIVSVVVLLLAASVVRRLHDGGRSGWWGLPPALLLATGLGMMAHVFASLRGPEPDMALFALLFVNNLVYLITLLALVLQLVRAATPGTNRYGDPAA